MQGRSQHLDVALFLGQEQEHIAAMQSVPGTAPVISGYAAMPPHGQPNASRQLVLLNGRSVSAPPVCRWVLSSGESRVRLVLWCSASVMFVWVECHSGHATFVLFAG